MSRRAAHGRGIPPSSPLTPAPSSRSFVPFGGAVPRLTVSSLGGQDSKAGTKDKRTISMTRVQTSLFALRTSAILALGLSCTYSVRETTQPPKTDLTSHRNNHLETSGLSSTAQAHLVSAAIQGDWQVVQGEFQQDMKVSHKEVGILTIEGSSYKFRPLPGKGTSGIDKGFQFLFNVPVGEIEVTYETSIHADDSFDTIGRRATLATCTFRTGAFILKRSLIRVNDKATGLYFHSMVNELGLLEISKKLD